MPKYKVEHYEKKIRRHFDPLVEEQELLVKQFKTEATKRIVGKLSKKMGADKIIDAFKKAEDMMKKARQDAKTFFKKKAKQDEKKTLTYSMRDDEISLSEGEQLAQLESVKQKAMDIVYENGDDLAIAKALDTCTKKIGITWVVDTSKIKQISA